MRTQLCEVKHNYTVCLSVCRIHPYGWIKQQILENFFLQNDEVVFFKSYQLQAIQQERQQQNINNILSKRYANDPVLFLWRLADRRCEGTTKIKYPITCTRLKMQRLLLVLSLAALWVVRTTTAIKAFNNCDIRI